VLNRTTSIIGAMAVCLALIPSGSILAAQRTDSGEVVMRPVISEETAPVEAIAPVAADGYVGMGFLRKPPGDGPFPVVVLIHGGGPRWPTPQLREFAVHTHASRFLEAGYVVAAITRRDLDLSLPSTQEQESVVDAVAVIDYLKDLPYVDAESIVVRGTSVGGYIALEVGAARAVAAIMVEEPFSMPFVGIGPVGGGDAPVNTDKIARISKPILLIRGDQTPNINDFNREVFIPALRSAGKSVEVVTYPGELHSFAFYNSPERTLRPGVTLEAHEKIDSFFREHLMTQPTPIDPRLVEHVPAD
jgi:dipeptidyl aminopeptidase/acylaminoacyl peptidase